MPWQGDSEVLIDRFDGRAHLDYIPEHKSSPDVLPPTELEERQANYERYRILVQNEFLGGKLRVPPLKVFLLTNQFSIYWISFVQQLRRSTYSKYTLKKSLV